MLELLFTAVKKNTDGISKLPDVPTNLWNCAPFTRPDDPKIYLPYGRADNTYHTTISTYNTDTNEFIADIGYPAAFRSQNFSVLIGNDLYLGSGRNNSTSIYTISKLPLVQGGTFSVVTTIPNAATNYSDNFKAVTIDSKIYCYAINAIQIYNPTTNTWVSAGVNGLAGGASGTSAMVLVDRIIYYVQGSQTIGSFNVDTGVYRFIGYTPVVFGQGASITALNGKIYVTSTSNDSPLYEFDLVKETWVAVSFSGIKPPGLNYAVLITLGGSIYLMGGIGTSPQYPKNIWKYTPPVVV